MTSKLKHELTTTKRIQRIGIPTIDKIQYFSVDEIIKCEGLQKCTKVILQNHPNIVSAYNIGEFIKILAPYDFFAPHKSHLINLNHVKTYLKEGTIVLSDNQKAPLARRRKKEFLDLIPHL